MGVKWFTLGSLSPLIMRRNWIFAFLCELSIWLNLQIYAAFVCLSLDWWHQEQHTMRRSQCHHTRTVAKWWRGASSTSVWRAHLHVEVIVRLSSIIARTAEQCFCISCHHPSELYCEHKSHHHLPSCLNNFYMDTDSTWPYCILLEMNSWHRNRDVPFCALFAYTELL